MSTPGAPNGGFWVGWVLSDRRREWKANAFGYWKRGSGCLGLGRFGRKGVLYVFHV